MWGTRLPRAFVACNNVHIRYAIWVNEWTTNLNKILIIIMTIYFRILILNATETGVGCDLCLWHSLDISINVLVPVFLHIGWKQHYNAFRHLIEAYSAGLLVLAHCHVCSCSLVDIFIYCAFYFTIFRTDSEIMPLLDNQNIGFKTQLHESSVMDLTQMFYPGNPECQVLESNRERHDRNHERQNVKKVQKIIYIYI